MSILAAVLMPVLAKGHPIANVLNDPALKGATVAVCVTDDRGQVVFESQSDRRMVPASNMKLLTVCYAFNTLGADYKPVTKFWREGDITYVYAPGDPSIASSQLVEIAKKLGGKSTWVHLDQRYAPGVHPTWEIDDLPNRYAAPVYAFSVDRASFEVKVDQGKLVEIPAEFGLDVVVKPTDKPLTWNYNYWADRLFVAGTVPKETKTLEAFALAHPHRAASRFLGGYLVPDTHLPDRAPDAVIEGPTLADLAVRTLTNSDNFYAENLLLMAATHNSSVNPADPYPAATSYEEVFLNQVVGWPGTEPKVVDGSGLSRQNLVTPRGICQLLVWAKKQPWFGQFENALAQPGKGTLEDRMGGATFKGKTGTLTRVHSLSGYYTTSTGKVLVFSCQINNCTAPSAKQRNLLDRMVQSLEGS
ncbi:MAG: D-alanyl-D-alanine carboxypeptidase [Armatimonadetes bacterium]|nr:D-alanyl-D-alanine carboxypeptidase [Armatimonadota bacterium]